MLAKSTLQAHKLTAPSLHASIVGVESPSNVLKSTHKRMVRSHIPSFHKV